VGVKMFYGTCEAGPWKGKQMAHAEPKLTVFLEPAGRRWATIPGKVALTAADIDVRTGTYTWDDTKGAWSWAETAQ
jgi:hypothetical protein